ncbi:MAG: DUF4976 domain-containing protein [Spirochaetaceae bacterium]|nr:MAG: DUF4976 domain-containing protein [Spirochaetaceae bacterium]
MTKRPHIVIFNPDQFRADALGHLGNPAARTPVLDSLVEHDAVSFDSAFCQNPVCTPSRCSFMTGWYPHVLGHRTMYHMLHAERSQPNLLSLLKENGYFVWWGGKNDLLPGQDGYDDACDLYYRPTPDDFARWGHESRPGLHSWTEWRGPRDGDNYYSFYAGRLPTGDDDVYCDNDWANVLGAVDFIDGYDGDRPLCIYLPLLYPHPPYGVEEPWFSAIDRAALPPRIPAPADWKAAGKPSILAGITDGQGITSWSEERFTELRATYHGMCSRIDHQFGLVIDVLKKRELYDDTAIFFFSDHGDFTGDYGLVEKTQNTFEEVLTRVPLVVKPPRHDAAGAPVDIVPGVRRTIAELLDFPATVYALAGIEPGYHHFGRSLLPSIADPAATHRDEAHCEGGRLVGEEAAMEKSSAARFADPAESLYYPRTRLQMSDDDAWHTKATMLRTDRWKYVRRLYERDELYDLETDPGEQHNRIDDPELRSVVLDLKERMLTWYQETADTVPFALDERSFG